MQLHNLKKPDHIEDEKRVGRGGKSGRYCGRGIKGQRARAGANIRPQIRDFIKSIPKLRGWKFKQAKEDAQVVNLDDLDENFKKGETVSAQSLEEKDLVAHSEKRIKILGAGRLTKPLTFEGVEFSNSARKEIEAGEGKILED